MSSPYAGANMDPYQVTKTPYQLTLSPSTKWGLPFCSGSTVPLPVLTGPQNMFYMVTRLSQNMAESTKNACAPHGSWNNWLSVMQENNGTDKPVMVAPFLPGNCSPVQNNAPIKNAKTQTGVPVWFEDGGQGGDHVLLSYKDANTGVFVGNSYRICTFGFSHIESPYSTTSACGNQIGTSPKTQSGDDAYCQGCSPSTKTVMYLSWIDDNVSEGSVILGWMRPNCAAVAQSLSYHCLCLDDDDCMNSYDKAFPSLRGAAVDFYFTLNDGYANTPSFNPLPTDQPPYLQLGQSFMMSMQGLYYGSTPTDLSGWGLNYPCPIYFNSYNPVGDGDSNNVSGWQIYGYAPVRDNSPNLSANDNLGYFQVVPLGASGLEFPSPSAYCATPPSGSAYDWWCGGTSRSAWEASNASCTPSHVSCVRNSLYSGWQCLGSTTNSNNTPQCGASCVSVAGVCDASGNCTAQNSLLYTPKCTGGKWQCVKRDESWIAIAVALLVFLLLVVWFFIS